uniref:(northern house mosquito) hypothetical protein n=1 Tax=Culex pipiens TaxID=7175 RepID=A0A8D8EY89_CULPI
MVEIVWGTDYFLFCENLTSKFWCSFRQCRQLRPVDAGLRGHCGMSVQPCPSNYVLPDADPSVQVPQEPQRLEVRQVSVQRNARSSGAGAQVPQDGLSGPGNL